MSTDKEHDKCELEEVVEDKVASNTSRSLDVVVVVGEEVPHVPDLEEEDYQPMNSSQYIIRTQKVVTDQFNVPVKLAHCQRINE